MISKLLSMTTMLSSLQPAASNSAWVLQRRSLNIWPEVDGVSGGSDHSLAASALHLFSPYFVAGGVGWSTGD